MKLLTKIYIITVIIYLILGMVLVLSSANSQILFKSHLLKIFMAGGVFVLFLIVPYNKFYSISKPLMFGIVFLLLLTLLFGERYNGATRWLNLWIISIQPSELAKLGLIFHLSAMIIRKGDRFRELDKGYLFAVIWIAATSLLVIIQPNVSTTIMILLVGFSMLYIGGSKLKHLFVTGFLAVTSIGLSILVAFPHALKRLTEESDQARQAIIALGSGGFFGLGAGQSRQSDYFIPEPYGDFIYAILGEEYGFLGAATILISYFLLFAIGMIIAKKARDKYGQLLAFGISMMVITNAFVHIAVTLGLTPTTGVTLPFISFGGTSMMVFAAGAGILMNIAVLGRNNLKVTLEPA